MLSYIPNSFNGKLLDIPVGTAVFTDKKYSKLKNADIICMDYSEEMLLEAKERFDEKNLKNVTTLQGDVGNLPFDNESFDMVLSMNGFQAFPDKEKAFSEIYRVLKTGGTFIACFYVKGKTKLGDWLANNVLTSKGWFSKPFETEDETKLRLLKQYEFKRYNIKGSIVYFSATKI